MTEILAGERELLEFEYPYHSPDEQRWFLMRAAPFVTDGTTYVVVAHSDITERKEYQQRLEESNERLEQFASAASHDLQEPLRMVTSYLQLLERRYGDVLDEEAEEFIEFAVDGAERMTAMIDGLLTYSRVETQGDPFESIDLKAVLDDVLADLDVKIEATGTEVTARSLPTVEGDASQLRQVFQNLLVNAIEYSGEATPRVKIAAERDGDEWIVSVSDDGIGIYPDDAGRILNRSSAFTATRNTPERESVRRSASGSSNATAVRSGSIPSRVTGRRSRLRYRMRTVVSSKSQGSLPVICANGSGFVSLIVEHPRQFRIYKWPTR